MIDWRQQLREMQGLPPLLTLDEARLEKRRLFSEADRMGMVGQARCDWVYSRMRRLGWKERVKRREREHAEP